MSQFQFEDGVKVVNMYDSQGKLIDSVEIPEDEWNEIVAIAEEIGVDVEIFIKEAIKTMLERTEPTNVGS